MNLQRRIELLTRLGTYMQGNNEQWQNTKQKAYLENHWFIPQFVDLAVNNIAQKFLQPTQLQSLADTYHLAEENRNPKKIGIVMAGNIPLIGLYDVICVFLNGNYALIKPYAKDEALIKHLIEKLIEWEPETEKWIVLAPMIRNCDAYVVTESKHSSDSFAKYFQKYPTLVRKKATCVAILSGKETNEDLEKLADDVFQYFGLSCKNVSKIFVPEDYDFIPLLNAFNKYDYLIDHHKYKNNYDYMLTAHILNNKYYMTNGSILLVEDESNFSPISQIHFEYYKDEYELRKKLQNDETIQNIVSLNNHSFGEARLSVTCSTVEDDIMKFLQTLN